MNRSGAPMKTSIFVLATLAAALSACSTVPDRNVALEQARGRVQSAQGDQQVSSLAPDELKRATDSLSAADKAWNDRATLATVDHLAYMTIQRVVIAKDTASSK